MEPVTVAETAWLAGFWDGEGSVGFIASKSTQQLLAQLSHTDFPTVLTVLDLLARLGVRSRGYTYQERDPAKHRDAHYVRVNGMGNVRCLAEALLPYAVTKRRHWEVAIQWSTSRIVQAGGLNSRGHLFRGGSSRLAYTEADLGLVAEMGLLNRRGPVERAERRGRIQ